MFPLISVRSRFNSWSVSTPVFGDGVKTLFWCFFLFVPRAMTSLQCVFTSVRCQRSASYCSVVKDYQLFSNRHVVRCAVRSAARQHNVGCIVATHSICYVFKGELHFRLSQCVSRFCVVRSARQPSIYHRCACVLHLAPAQNRTVELKTAGTHRCYYHEQDLTETR